MQKAVRYTLHSMWGKNIEYLWLNANNETKAGVLSAMADWRAAANYRISFSEITRCVRWNKFCWVMGWKYFLRIRTVGSGNFWGQSTLGNVPWANMDFKVNDESTFLHEIGHTLGLYHEHQRADRDNYITYYPDSVESGGKSQFSKMTAGSYNYYGSTFDFNSIMLYDSRAYGKKIITNFTEHRINNLFGYSHSGCCHYALTITKKDGNVFYEPKSISETDVRSNICIYPNPASDRLQIGNTDLLNINKIEICDIAGKTVALPLLQDKSFLDISFLQKGIYFLKLTTDKGTQTVKFAKE